MGGDVAGSGIAHAEILVEFAEAAMGADPVRLAAARNVIIQEMGGEALCDTAAVAALFNAIDRVADATGIPLEEEKAEMTAGMRDQLGIDELGVVAEEVVAAE